MSTRLAASLLCVALGALAMGACGGNKKAAAPSSSNESAYSQRTLLHTLSILAGDFYEEEAIDSWNERISKGESSVEAFIESLIENPSIGNTVAPSLIFGPYLNVRNYYAIPSEYTLKTAAKRGGRDVLYLRKPCKVEEAEEVRPWWNPSSTVLVCPDAHVPDRWSVLPEEHSYRSRMPLSCDGQVGSPEKESKPLCGCGPNLIRCLKDQDMYMEMHKAAVHELESTTAYIVNNNMPLSRLFTSNESKRNRNAEYLYQRRTIGATHDPNILDRIRPLKTWPEAGVWAPREQVSPGQHAGVLTGLQLLTWLPDRRQRQRGYYEIMWCAGRDSFGATTKKIFEVSESANLAFVHDSWERLAHTELCTKCHARLDYGFQFFMGYPDARAGTHFIAEEKREGRGPLYADDIEDPRGEGELTPAGFARLAVAQPEFNQCMANHVSNYVLGPAASEADRSAVLAQMKKDGKFRSAMRVAMQRFAANWPKPPTKSKKSDDKVAAKGAAAESSATGAADELITLPTALEAQIDELCTDCHLDEKHRFVSLSESYGHPLYLGDKERPRKLVVRMLDQIAFENMPRGDEPLAPAKRAELVNGLIDALWTDEEGRANARDYFGGQMQALPAHQFDVAISSTRRAPGKSVDTQTHWGAFERSIYADQNVLSPGYITTLALEAASVCKKHSAGADDTAAAFDQCLADTLQLDRLSRWPE